MAADVFRDDLGIPHLRADSVEELSRLQGRTAALDRAWQLDWQRRRAEGRTAEVVGRPGLVFDRFARQARVDATARRSFERLDPETQDWCRAFVDGVNDGLNDGAAAAEDFGSLGVTPGRWQPWSPIAVFAIQQLVFGGFALKLWRRHVAERLGPEAVDLLDAEHTDPSGSNAWGVLGHRTAGGKPMIAGDSHRNLEYPGVYHQVRLACDEFDVFGFSFPGVPGIQHFGHAGPVAWAITNACADYQDLYLEELSRTGDEVTARGSDGPEPVQRSEELIMVRDAEPELVEILITARGPVIIDNADHTMSLRRPSMVEADAGFGALLPLLRSRSVDDVEQAMQHWVEPVNSAIVADHTGRMRHLVPGRVPIRDLRNLDVPVPAWDRRFAWTGDYAPMPAEDVDDLIANGNDRDSGGGLGNRYVAPWRAHRIRTLLQQDTDRRPADADTMASIHRDAWSGPAARAQELLRRTDVTGPAQLIKSEILAWDGQMTADSRPALLYATWRAAMINWLCRQPALAPLQHPVGIPDLFVDQFDLRRRIGLAFDAVCANADRLGIDLSPGVAASLQTVAAEPPAGLWGDAHRLAPLHGLTGIADDLAPPMPTPKLSGDLNCVLATTTTPGITHLCSNGSVTRYVWDLADPSASRWVVPFGASGATGDPHATDQNDAWVAAELFPVITDWSRLTQVE